MRSRNKNHSEAGVTLVETAALLAIIAASVIFWLLGIGVNISSNMGCGMEILQGVEDPHNGGGTTTSHASAGGGLEVSQGYQSSEDCISNDEIIQMHSSGISAEPPTQSLNITPKGESNPKIQQQQGGESLPSSPIASSLLPLAQQAGVSIPAMNVDGFIDTK